MIARTLWTGTGWCKCNPFTVKQMHVQMLWQSGELTNRIFCLCIIVVLVLFICTMCPFGLGLLRVCVLSFTFPSSSFFFSFFSAYEQSTWFMHMDSLCRRQSTLFMHWSRTIYRTHNYFIQKKNIKNESHDTIYTFKIYLVTMFLIFSKINYIQTNLRVLESQLCVHGPAVSAV